jgi:hypothetical protein
MLKTEKGNTTRSTSSDEMLLFIFRQLRESLKNLGTKDRQHEAPGKRIGLQDEGTCVEEKWIAI